MFSIISLSTRRYIDCQGSGPRQITADIQAGKHIQITAIQSTCPGNQTACAQRGRKATATLHG